MNEKAHKLLQDYRNEDNRKLENLLADLADVYDLIATELIHLEKESCIATQIIAETRNLLKSLKTN